MNIRAVSGESPLFATAKGSSTAKNEVNYVESVKLLLRSGARVNLLDQLNFSVLSYLIKLRAQSIPKTMVLLLYAAGESLDGTTTDDADDKSCVLDYLHKREICLKEFCRETIRKHLLNLDPHTHLFYRVPRLGLPTSLTQYLLFNISLNPTE